MQLVKTTSSVSFKNILFLTDFSDSSNRALAYGLAFARHFKAHLYPAHVIDADARSAANEGAIQTQEQRTRQQLLRQVEYNGVLFDPLLSRCDFESAIPHWVAEHSIDLIVMGTQGKQGTQRFVLGSASDWVVRQAFCPVLTVGSHVEVPRLFSLVLDKILFAAGLSSGSSEDSLQYALSLAKDRCARLTLLHVLPEESSNYHDRSRVLRFTLDELQRSLPAYANSWCKPEMAVDAGDPAERILVHAQNERPDLIVMGGPGIRQEDPARSTFYLVASSAPCPVLTVPGARTNVASRTPRPLSS
ncbi:MAG TPA: universal stress protein [Candidatus Angelobacter sp.]|nr:universal stress protein [Candidatus Angelobacter sp.]